MKILVSCLMLLFIISHTVQATDITGDWKGSLMVTEDKSITVIYHVQRDDDGSWSATHSSPDQYACGIPVTSISLEENQVEMNILNLGSQFQGSLNEQGNTLTGTFQQRSTKLDLILKKSDGTDSPITETKQSSQPGTGISGTWYAQLEMGPGQVLNLIYHISKNSLGAWSTTQDSPEQFMCGYPVTETRFADGVLELHISASNFRFRGQLSADAQVITGEMSQHGLKLPLNLSRQSHEARPLNRPQHPQAPYAYDIEQVVFENLADEIKLAGTLTRPGGPGPFPAAVLVSGSGAHDRDQTIFGHKPFWVIADHLARHGIAVLRYDERGVGQSQGVFHEATSEDLSRDVEAALNFLEAQSGIDASRTGIIGHSEGGIIGPMVAQRSDDVDFLVLMAAPADTGLSLILRQQTDIAGVAGQNPALLQLTQDVTRDLAQISLQHSDLETVRNEYKQSLRDRLASLDNETRSLVEDEQAFVEGNMAWATRWFRYFLAYDPAPALKHIHVPTLAINGDRDLQVHAETNLGIMNKANSDIETRVLPNLNHLFQRSETGDLDEYGILEQTIDPIVLQLLSDWIDDM